jgi:hypothetical protein
MYKSLETSAQSPLQVSSHGDAIYVKLKKMAITLYNEEMKRSDFFEAVSFVYGSPTKTKDDIKNEIKKHLEQLIRSNYKPQMFNANSTSAEKIFENVIERPLVQWFKDISKLAQEKAYFMQEQAEARQKEALESLQKERQKEELQIKAIFDRTYREFTDQFCQNPVISDLTLSLFKETNLSSADMTVYIRGGLENFIRALVNRNSLDKVAALETLTILQSFYAEITGRIKNNYTQSSYARVAKLTPQSLPHTVTVNDTVPDSPPNGSTTVSHTADHAIKMVRSKTSFANLDSLDTTEPFASPLKSEVLGDFAKPNEQISLGIAP